ncbi:hypothetical protein AURDEDRAFT_156106 [Auricularia subglabra TFB-10046 SS5]|nr:hypothetical protein AURDEDRAFT_156106 [Auricularia subglabra TFB-10046 SS5]
MSTLIDYITGLAAAASAGKMPSTKRANAMADWLLNSPLIQAISRDFRELVEAYQATVMEKKGDDILQDALYELYDHSEAGDEPTAATAGKFLTGQASWVWDDLASVLLPRVFAMLKEIPLPRMEYVDSDVEFVLENLNLVSLQLLPGHIKLSHTKDTDIDTPTLRMKSLVFLCQVCSYPL